MGIWSFQFERHIRFNFITGYVISSFDYKCVVSLVFNTFSSYFHSGIPLVITNIFFEVRPNGFATLDSTIGCYQRASSVYRVSVLV